MSSAKPSGKTRATVRQPSPRHPAGTKLRARLLDTMKLLSATTCFVHAHDVSQGRSRRASRRAVCLTPVIDAAEAQKIMSTKAAREVLTTDAMTTWCHSDRASTPADCQHWLRFTHHAPNGAATCACTPHLVHVLVAACVMSCAYRLALSVRLDLACHLECDLCCHASCDGNTASFAQQPAHLAGPILSELANVNGAR